MPYPPTKARRNRERKIEKRKQGLCAVSSCDKKSEKYYCKKHGEKVNKRSKKNRRLKTKTYKKII